MESLSPTHGKHDPSLLLGVPSIDREHLALLAYLDRLLINEQALPGSEAFSEVLGRLGPQISSHFENEEGYMRNCGMPPEEVAAHVAAHHQILEQYVQLNYDLMKGRVPTRADALQMIRTWIVDHVRQHDLHIRKYLPQA